MMLAARWPALWGLWITLEAPGYLYTYFGSAYGFPDIFSIANSIVFSALQEIVMSQSFMNIYAYSMVSSTVYTIVYTIAFGSLYAILVGATVAIISHQSSGVWLDVRDALEIGFATVLQVWGVTLVLGTFILLAEYFLLIPGILLGMLWAVSGSVAANEKLHLRQAATRSAQLTRNNRWKVAGVVLLLWLLYMLAELSQTMVLSTFGTEIYQNNVLGFRLLTDLPTSVIGFFSTLYFICMYVQLLAEEAGLDEGDIAFTFN